MAQPLLKPRKMAKGQPQELPYAICSLGCIQRRCRSRMLAGNDLSRVALPHLSHHLNGQRMDLCQVLALGLDHPEAPPVQCELGPGEELQQCTGDGHEHQQVEAALTECWCLRWGWGWWLWPRPDTPHRSHWGLLKKVMT